MCSIAGFFDYRNRENVEKKRQILLNMNNKLKNRGPDEDGIMIDKGCGFAHARLSIIDDKKGRQPMKAITKDGEYTIIYNGEIYNMKTLKNELRGKGITFETSSDTEIVLKGFIEEGPSFIKKLNGIFSFAIWDSKKEKLFLVRDKLGVKPLFYTVISETIVFSSEIKGLFEFDNFKPKIDKEGLQEIFGLGPAKSYGKGVFKDVYEVLSGRYIEFSKEGLKDIAYWELEAVPHTDNYEETVDKVRYLIEDAVSIQSNCPVPICSFLSGGVDSSLVTAIANYKLQKENKTLDTFSFDFHNSAKYFQANSFQPSQDRPYVDKMVEYLNTNHRYLECNNKKLFDNLFDAVNARDLPGMADVESSILYFCKETAKFDKVALTGECADEIFGGYPWFFDPAALTKDAFPWSNDVSAREVLLKDEVIKDLDLASYSSNAYLQTIAQTPYLDGEDGITSRRREISFLNLKWFMETLLIRMDRSSMYSGLEARVPFADYRIVEYLYNVPWDFKCPQGIVKGLLRKAGEKYLPLEVLYRKKSPYPKTYDPKYEKLLNKSLKKIIKNKNEPLNNFIDPKKVKEFISTPTNYAKPFYGQLMAGPQMLAYMIQVNYFFKHYNVEIL